MRLALLLVGCIKAAKVMAWDPLGMYIVTVRIWAFCTNWK